MTLDQYILKLQELQCAGHGGKEVVVVDENGKERATEPEVLINTYWGGDYGFTYTRGDAILLNP